MLTDFAYYDIERRIYMKTVSQKIVFRKILCGILCMIFICVGQLACVNADEPINSRLEKAIIYYTNDVITFDGNKHKFHLGMPRSEVIKIMDARNWNKKVDENWADKYEKNVVGNMKEYNFPEKDIAKVLVKNHGKSELVYQSGIKLNPMSVVPLNYQFKFENNKLIEYQLTFTTFFPWGNDGGNNVLTKTFHEIYERLGIPDANLYREIGTAGVWVSKDQKEIVTLKGNFKSIDADRVRKAVQENRNLNYCLTPRICEITIRHYSNPEIQEFDNA